HDDHERAAPERRLRAVERTRQVARRGVWPPQVLDRAQQHLEVARARAGRELDEALGVARDERDAVAAVAREVRDECAAEARDLRLRLAARRGGAHRAA